MSRIIYKPCPFCCNDNTPDEDTGGACCFCDYEGEVGIGYGEHFSTIEQYSKVYNNTNHQDKLIALYSKGDYIYHLDVPRDEDGVPY